MISEIKNTLEKAGVEAGTVPISDGRFKNNPFVSTRNGAVTDRKNRFDLTDKNKNSPFDLLLENRVRSDEEKVNDIVKELSADKRYQNLNAEKKATVISFYIDQAHFFDANEVFESLFDRLTEKHFLSSSEAQTIKPVVLQHVNDVELGQVEAMQSLPADVLEPAKQQSAVKESAKEPIKASPKEPSFFSKLWNTFLNFLTGTTQAPTPKPKPTFHVHEEGPDNRGALGPCLGCASTVASLMFTFDKTRYEADLQNSMRYRKELLQLETLNKDPYLSLEQKRANADRRLDLYIELEQIKNALLEKNLPKGKHELHHLEFIDFPRTKENLSAVIVQLDKLIKAESAPQTAPPPIAASTPDEPAPQNRSRGPTGP